MEPYANLSQRGFRRAQVNALKAMIPKLEKTTKNPRGSEDLGDNYVLLRAKDDRLRTLQGAAVATAVRDYMSEQTGEDVTNWNPQVCRWAQLRIPTGQIVCSSWKEKLKSLEQVRISRNIRVSSLNSFNFFSLTDMFIEVCSR